MRIAIFETEHFEVAYPLIRLFDLPGNQLIIFTNQECYAQLTHQLADASGRFQFIIRQQESMYTFIYNAYKVIRQQEVSLLFLSTVSNNFIFYYMMARELQPLRIILTIHDTNTFFQHRYTFSLRRIIRITGKKLLMKVINEYNVIAQPMVAELEKRIPSYKKVHCLPGSVFEPGRFSANENFHGGLLNLVVPGTVDIKRRDYALLTNLVRKIKSAALPVHVMLLGAATGINGEEVLTRMQHLADAGHRVSYYRTGTVPQQEYDTRLTEADLVLIPSLINTIMTDDIMEIYGSTKSSGTVFDAVRHAKPFIIPARLMIDPDLEPAATRYASEEDIISLLKACSGNRALLQQLQEQASQASAAYTIEAVRLRNPDLFPQPSV